jgi:ferredoxin
MNNQAFTKIIIYYFSGTGNARSVASWVKQTAELKNIDTEIINIAELDKRIIELVPENALIGFCSPTHGFNFPPIMLHFIMRFPKANNNQVFMINTRAGLKIGKFFIVGLSGIALLLSALVLKIKKYKIIGLRSIDLPSNWISIHPGFKPSVVESIFNKRKKDTIDFTTKIINGKKVYKALGDIIQDLLISPIAVGYYFIGRFVFAKSFIASRDCTQCKLCVERCPVNAIKIIDNRCYWTYKCESCMQCMNICPHRAIETAHGFIIGISYLIYTVILVWLYSICNVPDMINVHINGRTGRFLVFIFESAIYLMIIFSGYRMMHYLLRFRLFERIFVYSSLTTYKFWRRYKPSSKIQNLK